MQECLFAPTLSILLAGSDYWLCPRGLRSSQWIVDLQGPEGSDLLQEILVCPVLYYPVRNLRITRYGFRRLLYSGF